MIALISGEPLFLLTDPQAALMGKAIADAAKYYDFAPDGKIMSLLNLAGVSALVYIPMASAIRAKASTNRAAKRRNPTVAEEASSMTISGEPLPPIKNGVMDFSADISH